MINKMLKKKMFSFLKHVIGTLAFFNRKVIVVSEGEKHRYIILWRRVATSITGMRKEIRKEFTFLLVLVS
jgi:hypothetical protein